MALISMAKGSGSAFLILFIVILFAGMMVGGFSVMSIPQAPQNGSQIQAVDAPNNTSSQRSLQLKTINFITLTPVIGCGVSDPINSEPSILWATDPAPGGVASQGGLIKAFYQDEHALTLGFGNVSKMTVLSASSHLVNPNFGDMTKIDPNKFPYYPAIFISDITDDQNNRNGDAQNGGKAYPPDELYGTWKALAASDPSRNNDNLGSGADLFPSKTNVSTSGGHREPGFTTEIIWKVDNLGLTPGHLYRAQIILHDGDQTHSGSVVTGDIGENCTTIRY